MLNIAKTFALMGKLSNNIEHHGEKDVTAFDLPISGIELTQEQLNELLDDPQACAALYNTTGTGEIEPAIPLMNPHPLHETFEGALVAFKIGEMEFSLQDCRISKVAIELQRGGVSKVEFSLRVRPEKDKQLTAFLGHQNREIRIDVQDAKIVQKGGRAQPDLFIGGEASTGAVINGTGPLTEDAIGKAQATALENSRAAAPAEAKAAKKAKRSAHTAAH
jgi:hypothetical protein